MLLSSETAVEVTAINLHVYGINSLHEFEFKLYTFLLNFYGEEVTIIVKNLLLTLRVTLLLRLLPLSVNITQGDSKGTASLSLILIIG